MKIKILVPMAGVTYSYRPGDVVEHEDDDAKRLIAAGFAEATEPVEVESASAEAPETAAVTPKGKRKQA